MCKERTGSAGRMKFSEAVEGYKNKLIGEGMFTGPPRSAG